MATRKRAIIFSRLSSNLIGRLISALQARGYDVPLVVLSPGSGPSGSNDSIAAMGSTASSYFAEFDDPPAVLCVSKMSQVSQIFESLDPTIAISWCWGYKINPRILSHRSKFINMHPSPLPHLRGGDPYSLVILRPDLYPREEMAVTWHYTNAEYDRGRVILQKSVRGEISAEPTEAELDHVYDEAFLDSIDEALELVESGFEGIEQDELRNPRLPVPTDNDGRQLTDEERTITDDMDAEAVLRLYRATGKAPRPALLRHEGRLYHIVRVTKVADESAVLKDLRKAPVEDDLYDKKSMRTTGERCDNESLKKNYDFPVRKRIGMNIFQNFKGGALSLSIRRV